MLKKKLISSYPIPTVEAIDVITHRKFPGTMPVGSYIYRIQQYPGDIDILEDIVVVPGTAHPIDELVRQLQVIIKKIEADPNAWFADFKAGVDDAFDIDTDDWDPIRIASQLKILYDKNILDIQDFKVMIELIKTDQRALLGEAIRGKFVLRWTMQEIQAGYQVLPGGRVKYLYNAIQEPYIVKVDIWSWLENRFVEVSNFMILLVGKEVVNVEQQEYVKVMKHDIAKYFSKLFFMPFKSLKRMWVLSITFKDTKMTKKLNKVINSGTSIVYQVVGDLKALRDMINKFTIVPYDKMTIEVGEMKERLSRAYEINIKKSIYNMIDELYLLFSDVGYGDERKRNPALMILDVLIAKLSSIMNTHAMDFAIYNDVYPIPFEYSEE